MAHRRLETEKLGTVSGRVRDTVLARQLLAVNPKANIKELVIGTVDYIFCNRE